MYFVFIKPRMNILEIKSRIKRVHSLDILWKAVLLLQEGSQKYVWVFDATVFYLTLKDRLIDVLFCKLPPPLMTFPLFLKEGESPPQNMPHRPERRNYPALWAILPSTSRVPGAHPFSAVPQLLLSTLCACFLTDFFCALSQKVNNRSCLLASGLLLAQ